MFLRDEELSIRTMDKWDLPLFVMIRNSVREFLHNDNMFTLDDAQEWFPQYAEDFYFMIELWNHPIGYIRTSQYNEDDFSFYVGMDLKEEYRGKGYAKRAYKLFLDWAFNYLGNEIAQLEVFENNIVAKNLYESLGFQYLNVKPYIVKRNDVNIKSLTMILYKTDWNRLSK